MKGKILDFSIQENIGIISGEDGKRYKFQGSSWKEPAAPMRGMDVDFDINENQQALDIFLSTPVYKNIPPKINQHQNVNNQHMENVEYSNTNLSPTWQFRFQFFDENGVLADRNPKFKPNFRQLNFSDKLKINMNFFAFFFTVFYFFILGLWKKGLVILIAYIVIAIILVQGFDVSEQIINILSIAVSAACASIANTAYYLKEKRNSESWNPFEGIF